MATRHIFTRLEVLLLANKEKITWDKIFQDFKDKHKKFAKKVIHWQPYSYATIQIWLPDSKKILYNFDTKKIDNVN